MFGVSWRGQPSAPRGHPEDPSDGRDPEPDRARSGAGPARARSGAEPDRARSGDLPTGARGVVGGDAAATSRLPGRGAGPRARSGPGLLLVPGDRPRLLHRAHPDRPRAELAVRAPGAPPLRRDRPAAPHGAVGDLPPPPRGRGSAFAGPPATAGELHEDGRRDRGRAWWPADEPDASDAPAAADAPSREPPSPGLRRDRRQGPSRDHGRPR